MSVIFKLREPESKRPTAIIAYYYFDGKRFVASTRRKIKPSEWDFRRERPKASYPNAQSLTAYLNSLSNAIIDKHNWLLSQGRYPTPDDFRQAMTERTGRLNVNRPTLLQHLDALCDKAPYRSQYHNLRKQVNNFVRARRVPVQIEALNATWYNDFQEYLIANVAEGYAYRISKQLKTALRKLPFDWEGKAAILAAEQKAKYTNPEKIYLPFAEVRRLLTVQKPVEKKGWLPPLFIQPNEVAAMLYLACTTGLRISDWGKFSLTGSVIDAGQYRFVRIIQQKTGGPAYIPILAEAEKILKQNGGSFLPPTWAHLAGKESLRKMFNDAAREVAQAAGIDTPTTLQKKRAGAVVEETGPKWQFVSSKIGRVSFVSNFRNVGIPTNLLNLMTGHAGVKEMAATYDAAGFLERAPLLFPYLREFEERLRGGSKYNQETIFIG